MRSRVGALALLAVALSACQSSYQWFRPRVGVTGEAPDATPAGERDLWRGGVRIGELRLWSTGGVPRGDGTRLHVGLELENLTDAPIALEPELRIVALHTRDGVELAPRAPGRRDGAPEAAPSGRTVVEIWIDVAGVAPWDIDGFVAQWTVRADAGVVARGETEFIADLYARLANAIELATMDLGGDGD